MTGYRIGTKVKIISDNENYDSFRGKTLKIIFISRNRNDHPGYDEGMAPELLFDLETLDGKEVPFSLYEYEVEKV